MESVKHSEVTPSKGRFASTISKVLSIKSLSNCGSEKNKSRERRSKDQKCPMPNNDEEEELHNKAVNEAFLAKVFASISSIKAAYAQLQFAQSPYDAEGIQSADEIVVSELKNLSELKHSFAKNELTEPSPETTLVSCEIQEQKSLLKTYEITSKKLDSQLKLKESEITFLKEKLAEANKDNRSLEKRLNSSGQLAFPENSRLSSLIPSHFVAYSHLAVKSIRSFVKWLIYEMESADWDLDVAASSVEPGVSFWRPNHRCFAFESYVCKQMFDGFHLPNFCTETGVLLDQEMHRGLFFDIFMELKSVKPADYLAWKPKSRFATFCRAKYLKLIHPKMEESLFGNLDTRNLVSSGELPETRFFSAFTEMAKRVWLLHCLAFSFDPAVAIYQVSRGTRFSEVYMESLNDEAFLLSDANEDTDPRVALMVFPGFRIGKTVVQCQVYLS